MDALFRSTAKDHFRIVKPYLTTEGLQGYKDRLLEALKIVELYQPYITRYISILSSTKQSFDIENEVYVPYAPDSMKEDMRVFKALSYPHRFLNDSLSSEEGESLANIQKTLFLLGFFTLMTANTQPKRNHVLGLSDDFKVSFAPMVYARFKLKSMVADKELSYFNKRDNGVPDAILFHYYGEAVLPVVRGLGKKGFFKDAKDASYFKNIYYAGGMLAVTHDVESGSMFARN